MSNSEPEEDFAALFAKHEARHTVERGQVVKGRVIQISDEHVFVDVGGKGEAWIDRAELTDDEGHLKIKVGDEVEATVVATGDEIRLSHRLRQGGQARDRKSTRLNSSHGYISYAVFCLKKKKK